MTADPVRRIANRRRIIAALFTEAKRLDLEARDLRRRARRLEAETDELEGGVAR